MRWSFKIGQVGGTDIRVHLTFLLFLVWIGVSHYLVGGSVAAWQGIIFIVALFGCVLLHEFGHVAAARAFGIRTPDVTLLPIGGVARLQRMPERPGQELVVALAGPFVNVLIAGLLNFWSSTRLPYEEIAELQRPALGLVERLAAVNIWLALFNLIPAFPMDGGRVLRAVLAMVTTYSRATRIASVIGQGMAFVFALAGLLWNPMLIFIAFFVYLGAQQEEAAARFKDLSQSLPVSAATVTHLVTLPDDAPLDDAVNALLRTSQHEFPVLAADGRVAGVLTRDNIIAALKRGAEGKPVSDYMHRDLPTVTTEHPFDLAFRRMQEAGCPAVPVIDDKGHFVGLITPENVGELMLVQSIDPDGRRASWRRDEQTSSSGTAS